MDRATFTRTSVQETFEARSLVLPYIETPLLEDAKIMTADAVTATRLTQAREAELARFKATYGRPEDITGVVLAHKV